MTAITYRIITKDSIDEHALDSFERHQNVKRCVRRTGEGKKILADVCFTEKLDLEKRRAVCRKLIDDVKDGCYACGAFDDGRLIGFASLGKIRFGSRSQYLELRMLHVSCPYRNNGIGKKLFALCREAAGKSGAERL